MIFGAFFLFFQKFIVNQTLKLIVLRRRMTDSRCVKIESGSETRDERLDLNEEVEKYVVNDKHGEIHLF